MKYKLYLMIFLSSSKILLTTNKLNFKCYILSLVIIKTTLIYVQTIPHKDNVIIFCFYFSDCDT